MSPATWSGFLGKVHARPDCIAFVTNGFQQKLIYVLTVAEWVGVGHLAHV